MLKTNKAIAIDDIIKKALTQATEEARSTEVRYDFDSVTKEMRDKLIEKLQN
ncbi:MAG: hypothetical protein LBH79_01385 [Nitrososphaerota archaeon]|jgi:hypothetical protein|nr:hypothetical protein [Nitrososphaerota archaeon]